MAWLTGPAQLKAILRDSKELVAVHVREQGVYFHRHLLFAACIPPSHLEMRVAVNVQRPRPFGYSPCQRGLVVAHCAELAAFFA
jgi:hypothetical protein